MKIMAHIDKVNLVIRTTAPGSSKTVFYVDSDALLMEMNNLLNKGYSLVIDNEKYASLVRDTDERVVLIK